MNNFSIFIAEDEDDRFLIERDWEESGTNKK